MPDNYDRISPELMEKIQKLKARQQQQSDLQVKIGKPRFQRKSLEVEIGKPEFQRKGPEIETGKPEFQLLVGKPEFQIPNERGAAPVTIPGIEIDLPKEPIRKEPIMLDPISIELARRKRDPRMEYALGAR